VSIVDFHVHSAPSLAPRHHDDTTIAAALAGAGVGTFVLKAHEGSTAERALLAGGGAVGSVVLNSPVGGANADAVKIAAAFGARVVWMPTISAETHQRAESSPELNAHRGIRFRTVPVTVDERVLPEWYEVFDEVAAADMVLAAGHICVDEAIEVFRVAHTRGVRRFLLNHPLMPFLGWRREHVELLAQLGVFVELGVLADLVAAPGDDSPTRRLAAVYPHALLVFGSDLGHRDYPDVVPGIEQWMAAAAAAMPEKTVQRMTTSNGKELLAR
jgi:Family of unknown function (DUF6282)